MPGWVARPALGGIQEAVQHPMKPSFYENFVPWPAIRRWLNPILHGRRKDFHKVGYRLGSCPNAEQATKYMVNLPTWTSDA